MSLLFNQTIISINVTPFLDQQKVIAKRRIFDGKSNGNNMFGELSKNVFV